jgi:hypothetical protein
MPTGNILPDGFAAKVTFADFPLVELWVKEPTPPGYEMGGPNPQTTMENVKYRTQKPKKLITVTGSSITVAYDPAILTRLTTTGGGLLGKNQLITVLYGDNSKHNFWGWMEAFRPNALQEGVQATAVCQLEASNINAAGVETGPVYIPPP